MNFAKNSFPVNFTVFSHFFGSFFTVTFKILNIFKKKASKVPYNREVSMKYEEVFMDSLWEKTHVTKTNTLTMLHSESYTMKILTFFLQGNRLRE